MSTRTRRLVAVCLALAVAGLGSAFVLPASAAAAAEDEATPADYARALKNKNAAVRKQAALALGEMGAAARPAVLALRAALLDEDEGVQAAAAAALEKIVPSPDKTADADLVKQLRASLRQAESRLQVAHDALVGKVELQQALKRAADSEAVLRKALDRAEAELRTARNDADRRPIAEEVRKAVKEEVAQLLREKEAKLADLERRLVVERERATAAQIEAEMLKNRNERLTMRIQEMTKELARQRAGGNAAVPDRGGARNPPKADVEGLVKSVDASTGLITLTVGSDAGLEKGHTLEVYRLGPTPQESKYLGALRILDVMAAQAVAQPLGKLQDAVRAGDHVAGKLK